MGSKWQGKPPRAVVCVTIMGPADEVGSKLAARLANLWDRVTLGSYDWHAVVTGWADGPWESGIVNVIATWDNGNTAQVTFSLDPHDWGDIRSYEYVSRDGVPAEPGMPEVVRGLSCTVGGVVDLDYRSADVVSATQMRLGLEDQRKAKAKLPGESGETGHGPKCECRSCAFDRAFRDFVVEDN